MFKCSFVLLFFCFIILLLPKFVISATPKIDSLLSLLKTVREDTIKINIFNALCWEYRLIGEYDNGLRFGNKTLDVVKRFDSFSKVVNPKIRKSESTAYNNIGNIYIDQGNYDKALENHLTSLKIREEIGDKKGIADSYNNIGSIYKNQGNYDKALENYLASFKTYEKIGNKQRMAMSYNNIGSIYKEQGNYDKALENYLASLNIRKEVGDKKGIGNSYNDIGVIYAEQGNYDKALKNYFISLNIRKEIKDNKGTASSYNNLGNIYVNQGNYDKAIENYFASLKIKEEIGDKAGISASQINIGRVFTKEKKYIEAKNYLNKGLILAKEIGYKEWIKGAYVGLSTLDSIQGNWKGAYQYHQLYSEIKDSIFNEESSKQISEMSIKYETEKKEQQIKLLNKDKEIQSKDLQRQKTIRNAVVGFLLLVTGFLFVLINRFVFIRKQKKVIEVEIEKSEKLLLNILPKEIAEELKRNTNKQLAIGNKQKEPIANLPIAHLPIANWLVTPKKYEMVTVMFTDFKGFTTIAEKLSAEELVNELDFIFKKFDEIISRYPIEKIKTIGDSYMCAGGLPIANTTNPADVVMAALEIQKFMEEQNKWQLRIGVHSGPVIAGVVGDKKFAYDIWGDTVNTASRMESSGEPNKVNISGTTYDLLKDFLETSAKADSSFEEPHSQLQTIYRGEIEAKKKGKIKMYFVEKM